MLALLWVAPDIARAEIPPGVVVMAKRIDDIVSLDPAEAYEFSDEEAIANCYQHLLDYDPAHPETIRGALAQSWSVDADGRTYRFVLRGAARFASGRPVTAEDAAFSLQRIVLLDLTPAFVLRQFGLTRDNVRDRIRADGAATLVIETAQKFAPSLLYYVLTSSLASVVDKAAALAHEQAGDLGHRWLEFHQRGLGSVPPRIGARTSATCSTPCRARPRTARSSSSTSPSPRRSACC